MDKKTLLILFYTSVMLPLSYTLAEHLLPEYILLGFGLFNLIVLIIFSLSFSTPVSSRPSRVKKMGLVFLALFTGALLFSGVIDNILIDGSGWFRQMMSYSRTDVVAPSHENITASGDVVYTGDWNITISDTIAMTGETVTSELSGEKILLESDDEVLPEPTSTEKVTDETVLQKTTTSSSTIDGTYSTVIPYLVKTYGLKDTDKSNPIFQFISTKSSLYSSFATAYSKTMIGKNVNPTTRVSCDTYLVLKGIAAGRKVTYTDSPFAAYRAEAEKRDVVNGCKSGSYVDKAKL